MRSQGTLHLLIGPVGAGKSTWAARRALGQAAVHLDVDTAMVRLFGADPRPAEGLMAWYLERRERCRAFLWSLARDALQAGIDVYLELGLVARAERLEHYARARAEDLSLVVVLFEAPRDVRRERVRLRNASPAEHVQRVPPALFEVASDAWEPPESDERAAWSITAGEDWVGPAR